MTHSFLNAPTKTPGLHRQLLEYMESHKGKHFDPECFEAFKVQLDTIAKIQGMLPDLPIAK